VQGGEVFAVLRELAQLARAVGSPRTAVKEQQHALAALSGQPEHSPVLVLQGEIRGGSALSGSDLRLGKGLRRGRTHQQNAR